jgi:hypothetical protein
MICGYDLGCIMALTKKTRDYIFVRLLRPRRPAYEKNVDLVLQASLNIPDCNNVQVIWLLYFSWLNVTPFFQATTVTGGTDCHILALKGNNDKMKACRTIMATHILWWFLLAAVCSRNILAQVFWDLISIWGGIDACGYKYVLYTRDWQIFISVISLLANLLSARREIYHMVYGDKNSLLFHWNCPQSQFFFESWQFPAGFGKGSVQLDQQLFRREIVTIQKNISLGAIWFVKAFRWSAYR